MIFCSNLFRTGTYLKNITNVSNDAGIGQVVLQVAASTRVKLAYGVEKAEVPCQYAKAMDEQFRKYMAWYGKTYSDYLLEQGNFLENEHAEKINKAELVFLIFSLSNSIKHRMTTVFGIDRFELDSLTLAI